jgi:hypothetical protein
MFDYLLPNVFKKLGLALYILSWVLVIYASDIGINVSKRESMISFFAALGFALIINSKEKIEDERTMICRYKALGKSFRFLLIIFLPMRTLELIYEGGTLNFSYYALMAVVMYYTSFEKLLKNEL